MDWLNNSGSIASIVALVVTVLTFLKVRSLQSVLRERGMRAAIEARLQRARRMLASRKRVTDREKRELRALVRSVRQQLGTSDRALLQCLSNIEQDLLDDAVNYVSLLAEVELLQAVIRTQSTSR